MASEISLGEAIIRITQMRRRVDQGISRGLRETANQLLARVQQTFGEYQDGAGPFPSWAPLQQATIDRKARMGIGESPLIRSEDLLRSYGVETEGHEATIGSDSEYALIHETGGWHNNAYIPQRSTLGLTFVKYERRLFDRFNSEAWYEVTDPFGIRSTISHIEDFSE